MNAPGSAPPFSAANHVAWLALSLLVLAAAFLLNVQGGRVTAPRVGKLPPTCVSRLVLKVPCPGCGLTRSVVSLAHGQWRAAWDFNPMGAAFFAFFAVQIPYRLYRLRVRREANGREAKLVSAVPSVLLIGLLVAWIVRFFA